MASVADESRDRTAVTPPDMDGGAGRPCTRQAAAAPTLPRRRTETYATADIVEYDGERSVKVGREFLFRK